MTFKQAIEFYEKAEKFRHKPSLDGMKTLCHRLGDPQDALRFIHIAGTNGKGSCAAMLASVCSCAGMKTGLYTSPHLVDLAERIKVGGVDITHDDIIRLTEQIAAASACLPLSFFDLVTALSFLYFAEQHCDIVILECGLGGRFDATNVVKSPEISVIMPIGYDHTAVLGHTLAQIAGEKAGIIKSGRPVVCAAQEPEALAVIQGRCAAMDAPLYMVDINSIQDMQSTPDGQAFSYRALPLELALLGSHQRENAAAAVETARLLGMSDDAIQAGLAAARWPCRFELLRKNPPLILDGAHNPHGASALAAGLREYFPRKKFCFLLSVMADKDIEGILTPLLPLAAQILCVSTATPRALNAEALAALIHGVPALPCASPEDALAMARVSGLPCCICGSLYLAGYMRELLKN